MNCSAVVGIDHTDHTDHIDHTDHTDHARSGIDLPCMGDLDHADHEL